MIGDFGGLAGFKDFLAALIGGAFALAGTMFAQWLQARSQNASRRDVAKQFFLEHTRILNNLKMNIVDAVDNDRDVPFFIIQHIDVMNNSFYRNIELLIFLESDEHRDSVLKYVLDLTVMTSLMRIHQDSIYSLQREKTNENEREIELHLRQRQLELKDLSIRLKNLVRPLDTPPLIRKA